MTNRVDRPGIPNFDLKSVTLENLLLQFQKLKAKNELQKLKAKNEQNKKTLIASYTSLGEFDKERLNKKIEMLLNSKKNEYSLCLQDIQEDPFQSICMIPLMQEAIEILLKK